MPENTDTKTDDTDAILAALVPDPWGMVPVMINGETVNAEVFDPSEYCSECGDTIEFCPDWQRMTAGEEQAWHNGYLVPRLKNVRETKRGVFLRRAE